ncbi:hypothetical protein PHLCEN_2v3422 [Hermanssonia centrifuga]|uniref:Uncharacterized protein n=1 Tax=Hermanssonia centrifuga TaxID=98765 RepID=A0A2R6QIV5_9APHY|nr:hypothetical protein PHLCEN_2v3422 [Hermanssonia centrifuga]
MAPDEEEVHLSKFLSSSIQKYQTYQHAGFGYHKKSPYLCGASLPQPSTFKRDTCQVPCTLAVSAWLVTIWQLYILMPRWL